MGRNVNREQYINNMDKLRHNVFWNTPALALNRSDTIWKRPIQITYRYTLIYQITLLEFYVLSTIVLLRKDENLKTFIFCSVTSYNLLKTYRSLIREDSNIHRRRHDNLKPQLKLISSSYYHITDINIIEDSGLS
jgi:hypothetical protein